MSQSLAKVITPTPTARSAVNRGATSATCDPQMATCNWIKNQGTAYADSQCLAGYGVFSVSRSHVKPFKRHIVNQQEYHKRISFQDEFRKLCQRHGIENDERYVWDGKRRALIRAAPLGLLGYGWARYPGLRDVRCTHVAPPRADIGPCRWH